MGPDHHLLTNRIPTVSPTVFRLASMVPAFLNKARSEELRFRVGTQRARHNHPILWAMIASSPASGILVVSVILSCRSFLRLVPCPWVASSIMCV